MSRSTSHCTVTLLPGQWRQTGASCQLATPISIAVAAGGSVSGLSPASQQVCSWHEMSCCSHANILLSSQAASENQLYHSKRSSKLQSQLYSVEKQLAWTGNYILSYLFLQNHPPCLYLGPVSAFGQGWCSSISAVMQRCTGNPTQ